MTGLTYKFSRPHTTLLAKDTSMSEKRNRLYQRSRVRMNNVFLLFIDQHNTAPRLDLRSPYDHNPP